MSDDPNVFVYLGPDTEVTVIATREQLLWGVVRGGTFPLSLICAVVMTPMLVQHRETLALYVVYESAMTASVTSFRAMRVHDEVAGRMVLDLNIPADTTAWPAG